MLLSVERPFVGASAFHIPGATLLHCSGLVTAVLPASTERGKQTMGVPQELGRSCRLLSDNPGRSYRVTNSRPRRRTSPPGSEQNEWTRRYRQAKATKCGRTGGRKSLRLDSTAEAGERSPTGARGGKRGVGSWNPLEKHDECIEIRPSCPRNRSG